MLIQLRESFSFIFRLKISKDFAEEIKFATECFKLFIHFIIIISTRSEISYVDDQTVMKSLSDPSHFMYRR